MMPLNGEYHPDVAKMLVKIVSFQLEARKLTDAISNYLEALLIHIITHGNLHLTKPEMIKIG